MAHVRMSIGEGNSRDSPERRILPRVHYSGREGTLGQGIVTAGWRRGDVASDEDSRNEDVGRGQRGSPLE